MKFLLLTLIVLPFSLVYADPQIILAPVDHVYVPVGFDSNDSAEVIVTGKFPNACYSRNDIEVKVTDTLIDIKITAIKPDAQKTASRACPEMIVPFKEIVSLGNLQGGHYDIRVNSGATNPLKEKLTVLEAQSSAIDDHIYSAVEWVQKIDKNRFVLHGERYSNCIDLDHVKVVSNNNDTLSVLPIMKQLSDHCPMKMMPTAYEVKLDFTSLKTLKPLIYVRTMDGKSVNSIVNLVE
jgi:hypothetical protein